MPSDDDSEERPPGGEPASGREASADNPGRGRSLMSGRGLVVFPARRQAEEGRPPSHWIVGYLPFLVTIAAGAVVVVIIGILIGH